MAAPDDGPRPAPPAPRPRPPARPGPPPAAAVPSVVPADSAQWGRVRDDGTVLVRLRSGDEREVGQWPTGDPTEALAFYRRRFEGLMVEVELLERRVRQGALSADDAQAALSQLRSSVETAAAVGDLEGLVDRLDALEPQLAEQRERRRATRAAQQEKALADKTELVAEAERIAESADWRRGADRLTELMDAWKALPRLSRATDDGLWRRFSSARTAFLRRRRQHYAEQHEQRDEARRVKATLAAEAETLAESTQWGPTAGRFRELMRQWKAVGPAPHRDEEALWQRFRAAQDTFFQARDADASKADEQLAANAEQKRALLEEAEKLVPPTDLEAARAQFRALAERWDNAGKVPRDQVRPLEKRMQAVEAALRAASDARWQSSNPEGRARAAAAVAQLEASLAQLRTQEQAAVAAGDGRRLEQARQAIEARSSWLDQARRTLTEFGG
jgi:hypothetical protein